MKHLLFFILIGLPLISYCQLTEIYVCDAGDFNIGPWQIAKFDENGENPMTFINSQLGWPQDILFLEKENTVLITNLNSGRITRYNANTGTYIDDFATGLSGPTRMKIGADSLLYVLQWSGSGHVVRFDQDGTFLGNFTNAGVTNSIGMDWDSQGNFYVSSYSGDFVRKYNANGENLGQFITANLVGPTNIWFDQDTLYVLDYDGGAVKRFDIEGNYLGVFISGLNQCEGVDFLENGDFLIGNGGTSEVKRYTSEGDFVENFIPVEANNGLRRPNAVVIRRTIPSAIQDNNDMGFNVQPTIGKIFCFQNTTFDLPHSIKVFNSDGLLIEVLSSSATYWNASIHPFGTFYIQVIQRNFEHVFPVVHCSRL